MSREKIPNVGAPKVAAETQEGATERIPTKDEAVSFLTNSLEGVPLTLQREISDEKGLLLLEMKREGDTPGETIEYNYIRKGKHKIISEDGIGREVGARANNIEVTYYQDGMPVHGTTFALYDESSGTWNLLPPGPPAT